MARTHLLGQCRDNVVPFLKFEPAWFIDCGPGSGCEALEIGEAFPHAKLLMLEPSRAGLVEARERLPRACLLPIAVWSEDCGKQFMKSDDLNHGTFFYGNPDIAETVQCRSLDSLDQQYGPFSDALLWMDIEGSEAEALKGAEQLFKRGAILGVNLEMRPETTDQLSDLLTSHGLKKTREYFVCETYRDELWQL